MGYSTRYSLSWKVLKDAEIKNCEHDFSETFNFCPECGKAAGWIGVEDGIVSYLSANRDLFYGVNCWGESEGKVKWYDYDDNMRVLSRTFPQVLFTLSGEGEVSEDIWRRYYLGGKCQVAEAKIVFDEFDEGKLKGLTDV